MECTSCSYPDTMVIRTSHDDDNQKVYRRRECVRCGGRFNTEEVLKEKKQPPSNLLINQVIGVTR